MILSNLPMKTLLPILFLLFGCTLFGQNTIQKSTFTADNTQHWQEVEPFKNGFARVLKDDQFSFINLNGQCISNTFFKGAFFLRCFPIKPSKKLNNDMIQ